MTLFRPSELPHVAVDKKYVDEQHLESLEMDLLLAGIERRYGYDFRNYSQPMLRRRIRQAVGNEGLESVSELQHRVLHDPHAMSRFVESLSVHVSSMFRDPAFYLALRNVAVPILRTYPFIRVWHAGCATGEEVYSLAILLKEEGLYERARIYATDMSEKVLSRAREGVFSVENMKQFAVNYRLSGGKARFDEYYVSDGENGVFRETLKRNLFFSEHNLVCDGPFNAFHLILCRNVLIYFNQQLRGHVLQLLNSSLIRFGLLGLGLKESLEYSPLSDKYEELVADTRLYRANI